MNITEIKQHLYNSLLNLYPHNESKKIASMLIEDVTHLDNIHQSLYHNKQLSIQELKKFENALSRLLKNEPIQYILGYTEFFDMQLKVDKNVLIPRRETEELVYWIIQHIDKINNYIKTKILDIGTGTGCIALAIQKNFDYVKTTGWDISEKALKIATYNANTYQLPTQFEKYDILNDYFPNDNWDIIVSNPPYVLHKEKHLIKKNVLNFEPKHALYVDDNQPLQFYEKIILYANRHLNKNGYLFFEINELFGEQMISLLKNNNFSNIELKKDIQGKYRMIKGEKL